jgi:hypothetical protein
MILTDHMLNVIAVKLQVPSHTISVLEVKHQPMQGCVFKVVIDGSQKVQNVYLSWLS